MGFNTQVLIRNADLDAIAADPEFGQVLADTVSATDVVTYARRQTGGRGPVTNHDLSELRDLPGKGYEIQVSHSYHASTETASVIQGGQLLQASHGQGDWTAMTALAEALSLFGFRSMRKEYDFVANAAPIEDVDHLEIESRWMKGWSAEAFETAVTPLTILNDGLHYIRKSEDLGQRLADAIRRWWMQERQIDEALRFGDGDHYKFARPQTDIGLQLFSNAISIAGAVPTGRTDILVTGGNWGRMLRPFLDRRIRYSQVDYFGKYRDRDIDRCVDDLKMAGFMVRRPGRQRSESAVGWNQKNWVAPPVDEPAGPAGP